MSFDSAVLAIVFLACGTKTYFQIGVLSAQFNKFWAKLLARDGDGGDGGEVDGEDSSVVDVVVEESSVVSLLVVVVLVVASCCRLTTTPFGGVLPTLPVGVVNASAT